MNIYDLSPGGFAAATYLVTEGDTAVLIDCAAPVESVLDTLKKSGTALRAILLTHGHFDHMLTVADVKAKTGAPVYLARADADLPADSEKNAFSLFFGTSHTYPNADHLFDDGDVLRFGALSFNVMATPGHTRGSSTFLCENALFTGDTLFAAGYGRCDLFGGDITTLIASLKRLSLLPHDLTIYPGHDRATTLGNALQNLSFI